MQVNYYILSLKWSNSDFCCWWRPDDSGYTEDLKQVGVYPARQVREREWYYDNKITTRAILVRKAKNLSVIELNGGWEVVLIQDLEELIGKPKLTSNQKKALDFLREKGAAITPDICKLIKDDSKIARDVMGRLVAKGLAKKKISYGIVGNPHTSFVPHTSKMLVYHPLSTEDWKSDA